MGSPLTQGRRARLSLGMAPAAGSSAVIPTFGGLVLIRGQSVRSADAFPKREDVGLPDLFFDLAVRTRGEMRLVYQRHSIRIKVSRWICSSAFSRACADRGGDRDAHVPQRAKLSTFNPSSRPRWFQTRLSN